MTDKLPVAYAIPSLPRRDFLDGSEPCRQVDPEVFFPEMGGSPKVARRICGSCDVRKKCHAWAVAAGITHGVWGGVSMASEPRRSAHAESMRRLRARRKAEA